MITRADALDRLGDQVEVGVVKREACAQPGMELAGPADDAIEPVTSGTPASATATAATGSAMAGGVGPMPRQGPKVRLTRRVGARPTRHRSRTS